MAQQYSLRWNNHQPNFISIITSLLNTQTLVDVTLSAEGKQLLAHKVVLSACSTYFQSLFVDNPSPHPIVILKDVTFADLRIMVDFMYCGQVNVTEEQLPQVLDTAKLLKIKGLTEMPDSTLLTRSQGTPSESNTQQEPESRQSPASSPTNKRRRRRRSSTGSSSLNIFDRPETGPSVDAITLSSVPQQQRRTREYHEIRTVESQNSQQAPEQDNVPSNTMAVDEAATASVLPVVSDNSATPSSPNSEIRHRRTSLLKRQPRILEDAREVRKQTSDPLPSSALVHKPTPILQKYESYPQFAPKCIFTRKPPFRTEQEVALLIRTVTSNERQSSTTTTITSTTASLDTTTASESSQTPRASHTPAVRSGPPLSCNFCWNTVDECGRILRRKTQYHCPECRTNLCIVPCFHEYHEGPETELNTNAR